MLVHDQLRRQPVQEVAVPHQHLHAEELAAVLGPPAATLQGGLGLQEALGALSFSSGRLLRIDDLLGAFGDQAKPVLCRTRQGVMGLVPEFPELPVAAPAIRQEVCHIAFVGVGRRQR